MPARASAIQSSRGTRPIRWSRQAPIPRAANSRGLPQSNCAAATPPEVWTKPKREAKTPATASNTNSGVVATLCRESAVSAVCPQPAHQTAYSSAGTATT